MAHLFKVIPGQLCYQTSLVGNFGYTYLIIASNANTCQCTHVSKYPIPSMKNREVHTFPQQPPKISKPTIPASNHLGSAEKRTPAATLFQSELFSGLPLSDSESSSSESISSSRPFSFANRVAISSGCFRFGDVAEEVVVIIGGLMVFAAVAIRCLLFKAVVVLVAASCGFSMARF